MATKKQKRAAALQRHEDRMRELRERGERALQMDRERRAAENRSKWQKNHDKNHSWKKRIVECPLCQDELRAARKAGKEVAEPVNAMTPEDEEDLAEAG